MAKKEKKRMEAFPPYKPYHAPQPMRSAVHAWKDLLDPNYQNIGKLVYPPAPSNRKIKTQRMEGKGKSTPNAKRAFDLTAFPTNRNQGVGSLLQSGVTRADIFGGINPLKNLNAPKRGGAEEVPGPCIKEKHEQHVPSDYLIIGEIVYACGHVDSVKVIPPKAVSDNEYADHVRTEALSELCEECKKKLAVAREKWWDKWPHSGEKPVESDFWAGETTLYPAVVRQALYVAEVRGITLTVKG